MNQIDVWKNISEKAKKNWLKSVINTIDAIDVSDFKSLTTTSTDYGDVGMNITYCPKCGFKLLLVSDGKMYLDSKVAKTIAEATDAEVKIGWAGPKYINVGIAVCPKCGSTYLIVYETHSAHLIRIGEATDEMKTVLIASGLVNHDEKGKDS